VASINRLETGWRDKINNDPRSLVVFGDKQILHSAPTNLYHAILNLLFYPKKIKHKPIGSGGPKHPRSLKRAIRI
jgi:hypothetical protein